MSNGTPRTLREGLFGALKTLTREVANKTLKVAAEKAAEQLDPDRLLGHTMSGFIETAASRYSVDPGAQWKPGEPLRLLLAGYSGTRNTGADVRVEEMIRQFRHLVGDDHLALSILTLDPALSRGYFRTVKQLHMPKLFPRFLFDTVHEQHGVVACEGSMFKSKFANALSTMMVGALGLAVAENKISIGYGGEAGSMDPPLEAMVRRYCRDAFIITRNEESQRVLARLGITSRPGTDTAWTFEPAPQSVGEAELRRAGWDGKTPVLAVCPINPFWWPVRPDLMKKALHTVAGLHGDAYYGSVYFHNEGPEIAKRQKTYIENIARAITRFRSEHNVFLILVGMEQLDRRACEQLRAVLPDGDTVPLFVSDEYEMYTMVSVIRHASMMVTSRYHAAVTSMPGLVPSAGVTMDERLRNLFVDRGQPHLCLEVDDPELDAHLYTVLKTLRRDAEQLRAGIGKCVVKNLERMGQMGMIFVDHVRQHHPAFPFRSELGEDGDPWAHLPPLPPAVQALVDTYGDSARSTTTPSIAAE